MYKLVAIGVLAVLTTLTQGAVTDAAEIKVLSTTALTAVMEELAPQFERETGHKVTIAFASAASLAKRIAEGETADVAILTGAGIEDLTKQGKVVPGSRVDLARSGIGVAVRKGAPKPDIGSPEALKRALLAAQSVTYPDPAGGGASGGHPGERQGIRNGQGPDQVPHHSGLRVGDQGKGSRTQLRQRAVVLGQPVQRALNCPMENDWYLTLKRVHYDWKLTMDSRSRIYVYNS